MRARLRDTLWLALLELGLRPLFPFDLFSDWSIIAFTFGSNLGDIREPFRPRREPAHRVNHYPRDILGITRKDRHNPRYQGPIPCGLRFQVLVKAE